MRCDSRICAAVLCDDGGERLIIVERHIYIENDRIALAEYLDKEDDRACYDCWQDAETQAGYNYCMTDTFEEFSASPKLSRFRAVIVRKTDDAIVGTVFVSPPHVLPDLAIMIYRPYREQGLGTAAFALAAEYCFGGLGLSEVYAGCYEGNVRSRKMLAACGFVPHPAGNCKEEHFQTGEPIIQYDFVRRKYLAEKQDAFLSENEK